MRHTIKTEDFAGLRVETIMASSAGRSLKHTITWNENGTTVQRYIVTTGGEEYPFLSGEFPEAVRQYNEE